MRRTSTAAAYGLSIGVRYAAWREERDGQAAARRTSRGTPYARRHTSRRTPHAFRLTSRRTPHALRLTSRRTPHALRLTTRLSRRPPRDPLFSPKCARPYALHPRERLAERDGIGVANRL